ncbi:MAG: DUF3052 domain-containing protein [Rhizomicrobium sp.]|jgi:hypothetical protein
MVGYSGTPLARKLGIKPGSTLLLIGAPPDYRDWVSPLPEGVSFVSTSRSGQCDLVHLFSTSLADLRRSLPKARDAIKPDGAVWVSWTKKSAKIPTDVTEGGVRKLALATDLVDVKVCAVTDVWSGLKLVVRKHLR